MRKPYYKTGYGEAYLSDCIDIMKGLRGGSVDLVITSPPFALRRKKAYGNVRPEEYIEWFWPYAEEIYRILKPTGSFVLDIGGSWNKGVPTRNLYHFELLLRLCEPNGPYKLAQEFYWYNPAKLPSPAQWVTVERIRVKDAVNPIWWLAKSTKTKASNRRVLKPYTKSMENLFVKGYNAGTRPSGHVISNKWGKRHDGAIPSNLIISANTRSNDAYIKACKKYNLEINPARFVEAVPEFFIKFLSKPNGLILDPFSGSNVVGGIAERLKRKWISIEIKEQYVVGSAFRFDGLGEKVLGKYLIDHS